jgi:hypothetical protein
MLAALIGALIELVDEAHTIRIGTRANISIVFQE